MSCAGVGARGSKRPFESKVPADVRVHVDQSGKQRRLPEVDVDRLQSWTIRSPRSSSPSRRPWHSRAPAPCHRARAPRGYGFLSAACERRPSRRAAERLAVLTQRRKDAQNLFGKDLCAFDAPLRQNRHQLEGLQQPPVERLIAPVTSVERNGCAFATSVLLDSDHHRIRPDERLDTRGRESRLVHPG